MTVNDLYMAALAFIFEKPSASRNYDDFLFPYLNLLLVQNFDINNSLLTFKGLPLLDAPQNVLYKTDVLVYQPELVGETLIYGLAALFIKEDDTMTTTGRIYDKMQAQYLQSQRKNAKAIPVDIVDVYGERDY